MRQKPASSGKSRGIGAARVADRNGFVRYSAFAVCTLQAHCCSPKFQRLFSHCSRKVADLGSHWRRRPVPPLPRHLGRPDHRNRLRNPLGGAVGAGIEYGFAPHWSVGLEYDHLFMGRDDVRTSHRHSPHRRVANQRISQDVDIGMVRVNYTFGGPAVGRY